MAWPKEQEFKELLQKVAKKATKEALDEVAQLALREDKQGYKHVCALLVKELKGLKPQYRLKVFYGLSAIVRLSVSKRGGKDKYVERLTPALDTIGPLLAAAPQEHKAQMQKVLQLWWHENVFSAAAIDKLRHQLDSTPGVSLGTQQHATALSGAGGGMHAAPAATQESSGPAISLPGLSPMSLPGSNAASADARYPAAEVDGTPAGAATAPPAAQPTKRARVEWGARIKQASSALTAAASSGAPPAVASSTAALQHSGSSERLNPSSEGQPPDPAAAVAAGAADEAPQPPQPHLPPQLPSAPGSRDGVAKQQAQASQEYDPLAAVEDASAAAAFNRGTLGLPPLPQGLPTPPPHPTPAPPPNMSAPRPAVPLLHNHLQQQQQGRGGADSHTGLPTAPPPPWPPAGAPPPSQQSLPGLFATEAGAMPNGLLHVLPPLAALQPPTPLPPPASAATGSAVGASGGTSVERKRRTRWESAPDGSAAAPPLSSTSGPAASAAAAEAAPSSITSLPGLAADDAAPLPPGLSSEQPEGGEAGGERPGEGKRRRSRWE